MPPMATAPRGVRRSRPMADPRATGSMPVATAKAVISTGRVRMRDAFKHGRFWA